MKSVEIAASDGVRSCKDQSSGGWYRSGSKPGSILVLYVPLYALKLINFLWNTRPVGGCEHFDDNASLRNDRTVVQLRIKSDSSKLCSVGLFDFYG